MNVSYVTTDTEKFLEKIKDIKEDERVLLVVDSQHVWTAKKDGTYVTLKRICICDILGYCLDWKTMDKLSYTLVNLNGV